MLIQKEIIQRVKDKCIQDQSVSSCMMYGSFTKGEGDQYSDVEFYIFIDDHRIDHFSSKDWISAISPIELLFYNEYGTEVVVFTNMIRGEFHFLPESQMDIIKSFKPTGVFPNVESMYMYDSTNRLIPLLEYISGAGPERMTNENVNFAFNNFVNAWLFGVNVLKRGEFARSLEILSQVQKFILQLIRVNERTVERWLNSTKNLENDISADFYNDYAATTASLHEEEIKNAYYNALKLFGKLHDLLARSYQIEVKKELIAKLYCYHKE
ncbi:MULTISPECIES: nucleotidyltransferase [Sporosarcina]|uniref:Nucleotidyltransferase n=1 Tax=Sporosarcina contaminans TaxID=633403 RepID=A0ABW3TSQ7_9BACL